MLSLGYDEYSTSYPIRIEQATDRQYAKLLREVTGVGM
jgi:hypothetical protein